MCQIFILWKSIIPDHIWLFLYDNLDLKIFKYHSKFSSKKLIKYPVSSN